jgi:opine dehydrogenase
MNPTPLHVAVLGSGNGGHAIAFEWAQAGHRVSMFDFEEFGATIAAVAERGGISADGELEGFQEIAYAGHDIGQALSGADVVFAVGPAYSTEPFALACRPHLAPGQLFVVCPSSCAGAIVFKRGLGLTLDDTSVLVCETSTLPYAVRLTAPAHVTVYNRLKGGYFIAGLPGSTTAQVHAVVSSVHAEIAMATNVLQTTLQNGNPVIHPAVSLCNVALIERTHGDFLFYEEGVTEGVGRVIEAVDTERLAVARALEVTVLRDPELGIVQGYQAEDNYSTGYSQAPGFRGIRAQAQLDYRYFNEDAGFGLVFLTDLARTIGVPTPNMDAVLRLSSIVTGRNYEAERARTMGSLGLDGYTLAQLRAL